MEDINQQRLTICKEIDVFLKTYSRQVIQLKTLKQKLEDTSGDQSIFKKQEVSVQLMKESIRSCDMGQYLDDKTLANYAKEKKQLTFSLITTQEQQIDANVAQVQKQKTKQVKSQNPKKQNESQSKKQTQETFASNQAGFNKYLNDYSIHILERENVVYPELSGSGYQQSSPFQELLQEYCSIFDEDKYLLQQRLLRDIEDVQVYFKHLFSLSSKDQVLSAIQQNWLENQEDSQFNKKSFNSIENLPFSVIQSAITRVKTNKQKLDSEIIDMIYPAFSQYVQTELDLIKNRVIQSKELSQVQQSNHLILCQAWQMSVVSNISDLLIQS